MDQKKIQQKISRIKGYLSFSSVLILVLIGFILFQTLQIAGLNETLNVIKQKDEGLIDEFGEIQTMTGEFANDLNEIRSYFLLPTKNYAITTANIEDKGDVTPESTSSSSQAFFTFVDDVALKKKIETRKAELERLTVDFTDLLVFLQQNSFTPNRDLIETQYGYFLDINDTEGTTIFSLVLNKSTGSFIIKNSYDRVESEGGIDQFKTDIMTYLQNDFQQTREKISQLISSTRNLQRVLVSGEMQWLLEQKGLNFDLNKKEDDDKVYFNLIKPEGGYYGSVGVYKDDLKYFVFDGTNENRYSTKDELWDAIVEYLNGLDTRTDSQKKLDENKKEFENLVFDAGFTSHLEQNGLTIEKFAREDENYYYYDIKDNSWTIVASIALEKHSGEYKVIEGSEAGNAVSLTDYISSSKKNF